MQRSCGVAAVILRPFRRISPAPAPSPPAIRLKSLVLPAPFGPMMPSASPGATDRSISSAAITEPKVLRRPLIFSMRLSLATRWTNRNLIANLRRACSVRLVLLSTDRLHLAAGRNVWRSPVVGDDDVVFIAVLHAPLAADQRCLCDVFRGEWRQVRSVPLYLADHGIEIGRGDRSDQGFGIALRRTLQRIDRHLEQRMHEADRLRPLLLGRGLVAGGEFFRTHAGE